MPIKKFRDVSEMDDVWYEPGSAQLFAVIRHVWSLADRICPLRFPPGVHKHRTIEDAAALREQWEEANFLAHQNRMQAKPPGVISARISRHTAIAAALAALGDRELQARIDAAPLQEPSIGGTTAVIQVDGTPVFVKRVPLTDLERGPESARSTANLFELPAFYQYGVGSAGFGVWREVAAHELTTRWVLDGTTACFPLLHHHRVLDGRAGQADTAGERERLVAYWDGSPAVRGRLAALADASASVALFLEYLPHSLHDWLAATAATAPDSIEAACAMIDRELDAVTSLMHARGFLHLDAHFRNILTDGTRLYLADLGLATSTTFDLSANESAFVTRNLTHDRCHTRTQLVNWLVTTFAPTADRDAFIRRAAAGDPIDLPTFAAALVRRHAPIAAVINAFYRELHLERRTAPYPAEQLDALCFLGNTG